MLFSFFLKYIYLNISKDVLEKIYYAFPFSWRKNISQRHVLLIIGRLHCNAILSILIFRVLSRELNCFTFLLFSLLGEHIHDCHLAQSVNNNNDNNDNNNNNCIYIVLFKTPKAMMMPQPLLWRVVPKGESIWRNIYSILHTFPLATTFIAFLDINYVQSVVTDTFKALQKWVNMLQQKTLRGQRSPFRALAGDLSLVSCQSANWWPSTLSVCVFQLVNTNLGLLQSALSL